MISNSVYGKNDPLWDGQPNSGSDPLRPYSWTKADGAIACVACGDVPQGRRYLVELDTRRGWHCVRCFPWDKVRYVVNPYGLSVGRFAHESTIRETPRPGTVRWAQAMQRALKAPTFRFQPFPLVSPAWLDPDALRALKAAG